MISSTITPLDLIYRETRRIKAIADKNAPANIYTPNIVEYHVGSRDIIASNAKNDPVIAKRAIPAALVLLILILSASLLCFKDN